MMPTENPFHDTLNLRYQYLARLLHLPERGKEHGKKLSGFHQRLTGWILEFLLLRP